MPRSCDLGESRVTIWDPLDLAKNRSMALQISLEIGSRLSIVDTSILDDPQLSVSVNQLETLRGVMRLVVAIEGERQWTVPTFGGKKEIRK